MLENESHRPIVICADSTIDLPDEILKEYQIHTIPLHVIFNDDSYKDGVDLTLHELYQKVNELKIIPKTSAITPGEFHFFFKSFIDQGYDIFFTGISSQMSGTYQVAKMVAQEYDENRICIMDSGNLSTGISLLLIKMAKLRDEGKTLQEMATEFTRLVPYVKAQFVIPQLDYLYRGGRCTSLSAFFGTMLHIRPLILVRDGTMSVGKKVVGTTKKAVCFMVTNCFLKDFRNNDVDLDTVFITHSETLPQVDYIKELIMEAIPQIKHVYITEAGCVIGSHCGPGTIGILYMLKNHFASENEKN
jgi:DegV family protein with EDD domain